MVLWLLVVYTGGGVCAGKWGLGHPGNLCTVPSLVTEWAGLQPRPQAPPQSAQSTWAFKSRPISITNPRPQTNQPSRTVDKCNKSIPSYTKSVHYSACWVRQDVAWQGGAGWGSARRGRTGLAGRGEAGHGGAPGHGGARRGAGGRSGARGRGGARRSAAGAAGGGRFKTHRGVHARDTWSAPREE